MPSQRVFWLFLQFPLACSVLLNRQGVDLQRDRVSASYRLALDRAYDRFSLWCIVHSHPAPESMKSDEESMNSMLSGYVQFLFDENYGVSAGRHAVLAVQTRFRHLRGRLNVAWDSVKSWELKAPVKLRTPLPELVLDAMFAFAMLMGFSATGRACREWVSFGVGLLACFDGLLRPGEWALLSARKVLLPSSRLQRLVRRGLLTISNGKNRRVFGRIQIAMLDQPRTLRWLSWLTAGMDPHARLLPGGTAAFRRLFKLAVEGLGLQSLRLTPASLRAGGATARFARGTDLGHLKWWGRWASLATLEHYVQESAATMVMMTLPSDTLDRLESIVTAANVFDQPPSQPWAHFFSRASQRLPQRWTSRGSLKSFAAPRR